MLSNFFRRLLGSRQVRERPRLRVGEVTDQEVCDAIRSVPMHRAFLALLKDVVITRVNNDAVAGTSAQTQSTADDMSGFDSIMYLAAVGDVTNGCVLTLTAYSVATSAVTGGTSETSCTYTSASSTDADNTSLICDVFRPARPYCYATLTRTTQNAVVDGIWSFKYNAKKLPVTQSATVIASSFVGPNA